MKTRGLLTCLAALLLSSPVSAEPLFTSVDVFMAGTDGYHTFRIPTIVTTPDGSLIAFAEGRRENRHDPGGGDIDLVMEGGPVQSGSSQVIYFDGTSCWPRRSSYRCVYKISPIHIVRLR